MDKENKYWLGEWSGMTPEQVHQFISFFGEGISWDILRQLGMEMLHILAQEPELS